MVATSPPGSRPQVLLLVDDEPDILATMKTLLESSIESLKVITVPSARIGLDLLERERIDLIVSDFKMPGMDGIEFLYQCSRRHPTIPRVMFTAFGNEDLARRAVTEAFVSAFLSKGADPDAMVNGIERLLEGSPPSADPAPQPAAVAPALPARPPDGPAR